MRSKITIAVMATSIALIVACKKKHTDEHNNPQSPAAPTTPASSYDNYSALKSGNYWVYERYQVQPNGQAQALGVYDSCYISKDTTIRGQKYFKMNKVNYPYSNDYAALYMRDSLHYIIDDEGNILFSSQDFSTVFATRYGTDGNTPPDTLYRVTMQMADKDLNTTVAAGNFKTSSMQISFFMSPSMTIPGISNPRQMNTRYAKNIGIITETLPFFTSDPNLTERRLLRYHLN